MDRIGTSQAFDRQRRAIGATYAEMVRWQNAVATGKRIERLSDDPGAASTLLRMRSFRTAVEQYNTNLRVARDWAGNSEVALGQISDLLQQGYQLAVQGANATTDQPARAQLANQVTTMQKRLLEVANARGNDGQYLFGGQRTDAAPYQVLTPPTLTYNGDSELVRVETGPGEWMEVNAIGGLQFQRAYDALESLKNNLLSGHQGNLSGIDLPALQNLRAEFTDLRAEMGKRMQSVKAREDDNERRMDRLTESISTIEDVDLTEAVTELTRSQTAYQAALQSTASSFRMSLMDFLR